MENIISSIIGQKMNKKFIRILKDLEKLLKKISNKIKNHCKQEIEEIRRKSTKITFKTSEENEKRINKFEKLRLEYTNKFIEWKNMIQNHTIELMDNYMKKSIEYVELINKIKQNIENFVKRSDLETESESSNISHSGRKCSICNKCLCGFFFECSKCQKLYFCVECEKKDRGKHGHLLVKFNIFRDENYIKNLQIEKNNPFETKFYQFK